MESTATTKNDTASPLGGSRAQDERTSGWRLGGARRLRDAYARAYEQLLWPAWQRVVRKRPTFDRLTCLEISQWRTPDEIETLQIAGLRRLLAHAGTRVPYYRELFAKHRFDPRQVQSRRDLAVLPLLTRDIVRERRQDLVDPSRRKINHRKGTSGSTGIPLTFEYCDGSESWRQATRIRGYRWAGYQVGMPTFFYWPEGAVPPRGLGMAKVRLDRALRREVYVDPLVHTETALERAATAIRRGAPHLVVGYTQALVLLARYIENRNLRDWEDVPVICGAEAVLPGDRAVLDRAFGPLVFETYGSRETMLIAAECCAHEGMHLSEENLLVEIVNGSGLSPAGQVGDVVVTDLHNYGMPLIRYVNGDVAVMSDDHICSCGRGLRRLARIEGRRSDTLRDASGAAIPGMTFHALFTMKEDLVRRFQAVQRATGEVELRIVRGPEWSERSFEPIVLRLRGYLHGLPLTVSYVDDIPPSASGKYRPVLAEHA